MLAQVGGMNINNVNGADSRYQGMTAAVDWVRAAHNKRVPDPQEGRGFAMPWEWRSGEKTLEQCRHECLQHAECKWSRVPCRSAVADGWLRWVMAALCTRRRD